MKRSIKPILIALLFAGLLIMSAYFLKGRAIGDWVDAALYGLAVYFIFRFYSASSKSCIPK